MYNHHSIVRTTINIDDDVAELGRGLAQAQGISLGKAISALARRGARARPPELSPSGFYTFAVAADAPRFGPEDVRKVLAAEDREYGRYFVRDPGAK